MIVAVGVGVCLLVAVGVGLELRASRQAVLKAAEDRAQALVYLLGEWVKGSFRESDYVLRDVIGHTEPGRILFPEPDPARYQAIRTLLQAKARSQPDIYGIGLANERCIVSYAAREEPGFDISRRPYCVALRDHPERDTFVSEVYLGQQGFLQVTVGRKIRDADGGFAGIALMRRDMSFFGSWLKPMDVGEHGVAAIADFELRLAARKPSVPDLLGKPVNDLILRDLLQQGVDNAVYYGTSPLDGRDRIYAFRRLGDLPFLALVGIDESDALEEWRRQCVELIGGGLLIVILMLVWIRHHLTLHRQAELLAALSDQAQAAARAREQFLATMSHEIRTPLNGILGLVRLLLDRPLAADVRAMLSTVQESGSVLLSVLNDVLDFSKLQSGRVSFEHHPFDLHGAIEEVVMLMEGAARVKGLTCVCLIDAALARHVVGDGARLRQILLNLIGNAIKFTEAGGITVHARAAALEGDRAGFECAVIDTGIGIAAEQRERVFDSFVQADSSIGRRFGGTGLGLAICRQLVAGLGGTIGVDSTLGQGSNFWFRLPFPPAAAASASAVHSGPIAAGAGVPLPPLAILLAEDNAINQKVALGFLARDGHRVTVANNGREAIALAATGSFDIILMDMHMPEVDGLEACRAIRALPGRIATVPILAVSASALREDTEHCRAAGMDGHVAKPFDPATLFAEIARVVGPRLPAAAVPSTPASLPAPVSPTVAFSGATSASTSGSTSGSGTASAAAAVESSPPACRPEPLDERVLEGLERSVGPELTDELVEMFLSMGHAKFLRISALKDSDDYDAIRASAHILVGMAANIGCRWVAERASAIDAEARRKGPADIIRARITELGDAWPATTAALRHWLAERERLRADSGGG